VTVCWFALFRQPGQMVSAAEYERLTALLAGTPRLAKGLIFTPESTHDPYLNDGVPPTLGLQLYFDEIASLEAALAPDGPLQMLADHDILPSLTGAVVTQQAMLVRRFPVPEPRRDSEAGAQSCTYLVSYEGTADDLSAWLAYYIGHHPPIMARFPGIREIEIYTRLDWCGGLPWPRVEHMQRNKVVFDSAAALTAALNSPVRHEMRADFANFPPFSGLVTHFPLATSPIMPIP
jgi:uncharacterized protein (TIGR02118 family)